MGTINDLLAYKKGFKLAMDIFNVKQNFPVEERYSLTSQIVKSSRSVCINLREGYRKRIYPAHFISKCTDADMENYETQGWLEFAFHCKYITEAEFKTFKSQSEEVGRLLNDMINNPGKYGAK